MKWDLKTRLNYWPIPDFLYLLLPDALKTQTLCGNTNHSGPQIHG